MTAIGKAAAVERKSSRDDLLKILRQRPFTRILVYSNTKQNITGYINIYECLCSTQDFTDLKNYVKPIRSLPADMSVFDAMNIMQSEKIKMALVTRSSRLDRAKAVGIATMKDVVEELLGELAQW